MLSLSHEWANSSPLPQLDHNPIIDDHHHLHHHYHQQQLNLDHLSPSLYHHNPLTFPGPFSTPYTFPHHNPPPLPYSSTFSPYQPVQPSIGTLSGHPEELNQLGLNLGGQTYCYFGESHYIDLINQWRVSQPECQVEGCNADLSLAKSYHRRHKVCEFHSKASVVLTAGLAQRFCQQCSRFHALSEFDNGKRSCRKRLADHNRRRRKSHQSAHSDHPTSE